MKLLGANGQLPVRPQTGFNGEAPQPLVKLLSANGQLSARQQPSNNLKFSGVPQAVRFSAWYKRVSSITTEVAGGRIVN